MAKILGVKHDFEALTAPFPSPPLKRPVFLNSIPKAGTHLLTGIVRMFVPYAQHWKKEFIQLPNIRQFFEAFSPALNYLSWGHLLFDDQSALAMKWVTHVLLVRDPYDLVLARARFYLSDEFQGDMEHIKNGAVTTADVLNMMIFGVMNKSPSLQDAVLFNGVAWLGTGVHVVKYEELRRHARNPDTPEAETYFRALLGVCGIDPIPADWRERVRVGADPKNSRTARENLNGEIDLPDELPEIQKRLVDVAAPGLRAILGYE